MSTLIPADTAHEISDACKNNNLFYNIDEVAAIIFRAANRGVYSAYYYKHLSESELAHLKENGYEVKYHFDEYNFHDPHSYTISWNNHI